MSSKSGASAKNPADAVIDSRNQQNRIVVSLIELMGGLVPKGNSPEAKAAREAAERVKEKMIENCLA